MSIAPRTPVIFLGLFLALALCLPAQADKAPAKKKAKGPIYAVQFDVPQSKEEVWNFVEMISNLGFPAYMYSEETGGATKYYAQMGVFRSVEEAADAAQRLSKKVKVKYDLVYANTNKPVVSKDDPAADLAAVQTQPEKQPPAKAEAAPQAAATAATAATTPAAAAPAHKATTPAAAQPATEKQPPAKAEAAPQAAATAPEPAAATAPEPAAEPAARPEPEKKAETTKKTAPAAKPEPAKAAAKQAPAPATERPAAEHPSAGQEKIYLVQIYSFVSIDNAKETAKNYKQRGHEPTIYKLFDNAGKEWYAVSVGCTQNYDVAARIAKKFAEKESKSAIISKVDAAFAITRVVSY